MRKERVRECAECVRECVCANVHVCAVCTCVKCVLCCVCVVWCAFNVYVLLCCPVMRIFDCVLTYACSLCAKSGF